jgi:hypothetical protein
MLPVFISRTPETVPTVYKKSRRKKASQRTLLVCSNRAMEEEPAEFQATV